jgi:hypothetical protein
MRKSVVGAITLISALAIFVATASPGGASISLAGNTVTCTSINGGIQIHRGLGNPVASPTFKWTLLAVAAGCTGVGPAFPAETVLSATIKASGFDTGGPPPSSCANALVKTWEHGSASKIMWAGFPTAILNTALPAVAANAFPVFTIDATGMAVTWPLVGPLNVQFGGDWNGASAATYAASCPVGPAPPVENLVFGTPSPLTVPPHTPAFVATM